MLRQLNVLVADDHQLVASIVRGVLEGAGLRNVRFAQDGGAAYEILREAPIDIAIVDFAMPHDGLTLLRQIRTATNSPDKTLPVIVMTAYSDRKRIEAVRDAGATEIICKPLSAGALLSRIAAIIDRPRPFVTSSTYFGPDRRRRSDAGHQGPRRRSTDVSYFEIDVA